MTIFDIEKADLLRLSDTLLEELIARLAEAEVATQGHSPATVTWSGSINAPDGGIDIHVEVNAATLETGFLSRPNTIFQSKVEKMPKSAISSEMLKDGKLIPAISNQAKIGGSYIIVSLKDDCSPSMKKDRLDAMRAAVSEDANSANIHLDFFDRSKLVQWVRQHPSVLLWVKEKLGQGYSGWRPYGAWSNPPQGAEDTLISASGVTVQMPTDRGTELLSIADAIEPMRRLIRESTKTIRITGLSGVGKTRIVQALFDEQEGSGPLDRTIAVYVDTGQDPSPSAAAMLDRLIAEERRAILVLDNCPSALHSALAQRVSANDGDVRLITVEYDIREDKPQTTEVIHIESHGPEVAEQLLLRRFPAIGQVNARRVARFADGNARVALAIAERVEQGESLAQLSDADLFDRLFLQRKGEDDHLREYAEVLSLVYSFSVSDTDVGHSELDVLGSISGHTRAQLHRAVKKLADRHVVQKRAHWRAILPHAVANRLASSALESIPVETLRTTFETTGNVRVLTSFAHRLGFLHDHPVARDIVESWLEPTGLLGRLSDLNSDELRILDYVAPVVPDLLLNRIEAELTAPDFQPTWRQNRLAKIVGLLESLAYEPHAFDRCVSLLFRVAEMEREGTNYDFVRDKISRFFQPKLSGTHASLSQRIAVVDRWIHSEDDGRRSLGIRLLSTALDERLWIGRLTGFGARPRNYGYRPNHDELVEWRKEFIDLIVRLSTADDPDMRGESRLILADKFRGLWMCEALRDKLGEAARKIHDYEPWGEGWKAVRSIIYRDHRKREGEPQRPIPDRLADLERDLEPRGLIPQIRTYVLCNRGGPWKYDVELIGEQKHVEAREQWSAKATNLGRRFAASNHVFDELGSALFSANWFHRDFGIGLAKGADDYRDLWRDLLGHVEECAGSDQNFSVVSGFIAEIASNDRALSQELLDECARHSELRKSLVELHPADEFTETDLNRCVALLHDDETELTMFVRLLCSKDHAHIPSERLLELAQLLLAKPRGQYVLLNALGWRLVGADPSRDTLGPEYRKIGLQTATKLLLENTDLFDSDEDYYADLLITAALSFGGNEAEKREWMSAVFSVVDDHYGSTYRLERAIRTTARLVPWAFLDLLFQGAVDDEHWYSPFGHLSNAIAEIDVSDLIGWCQQQNRPDVWKLLAPGIRLWGSQERATYLNTSAKEFLEAAPEPEEILQVYASRIAPTSWSGSRADVMQLRADAINELVEHEREDIATAAAVVSVRLAEEIERQRIYEKQRDEEREPRFE